MEKVNGTGPKGGERGREKEEEEIEGKQSFLTRREGCLLTHSHFPFPSSSRRVYVYVHIYLGRTYVLCTKVCT